jgi:DNA-binding response OmpR family regulator
LEKLKRILVVDDDTYYLKVIRTILEKNNYFVTTVETGKEAIHECEKNDFDVVLLDMILHDMEGTDILKCIKNKSMLKIMVTGFPTQQNAIDSLNQGAHSYIIKPIKPTELLWVIKENLKDFEKINFQKQKDTLTILTRLLIFIDDGEWHTIDSLAKDLNTSREIVEIATAFSVSIGMIKYWKNKGLIKKLNINSK